MSVKLKVMKEFTPLKLEGKSYYILPESVFQEMLELIEDIHDNKVCDERMDEKGISLTEFRKRINV